MNVAVITALSTGIPAILGAVTAFIIALKSHNTVQAHIAVKHQDQGKDPVQ